MILDILIAYLLSFAIVGGIVLVYKFLQWLERLLT
jgi:hypothetical protein